MVIDSGATEIDNEYVGQVTPSLYYHEEVVQLQVEEERQQHDHDDMESDDEFDDDEGTLRLFNSDAFNFMIEKNMFDKLNDYAVDSGPLRDECLLVALYVGYLWLTQPNNFNRIMSRGANWLSAQVKWKLVKVKTILGKNEGGGRGHWNEVAQIQKLLVDEFNLTPFPVSVPSQDFMCFYRQNCSKHLSNYPVYVLMHEIKGKKSCIKKLYSVSDDGVFPNLSPLVLLLRNGHYFNVWDYQALYINKDVRGIVGGRKNVKGSLPCYKKRFCLHCMVLFCNEELHICEGRCRRCLQHHIDHDCNRFDDDKLDETAWCIECEHDFRNEFCYAAHLHVKLNGRLKSYCELLRVLDQCDRCISEFELI